MLSAASDGGSVVMRRACAVPARRRLFWLPPGQAGAGALDAGPASWVSSLSTAKWVPVLGGGDTLFPPTQVLLTPDHSRPDMPVVNLPPRLLTALTPLSAYLNWGSETPPPPVDGLLRLAVSQVQECLDACAETLAKLKARSAMATKANSLVCRNTSESETAATSSSSQRSFPETLPPTPSTFDARLLVALGTSSWSSLSSSPSQPMTATAASQGQSPSPSHRLSSIARESVALWRSVARAFRDGKLCSADKRRLLQSAHFLVLPTAGLPHAREPLLPLARVVSPSVRSSAPAEVSRALSRAGFLLDARDPRWCLADVAADLTSLLSFQSDTPHKLASSFARDFLGWLPMLGSCLRRRHSAPSPPTWAEATAFTLALATIVEDVKSALPASASASLSPSASSTSSSLKLVQAALKRSLPDLLVYCEAAPLPHDDDGGGGGDDEIERTY
mmetsp:Transcript_71029/g.142983  ORF Transcript_71029/g.142983 Transcript_71029/m.142983 type:complete len:448 (-) Transcript_71029:204-1547(-)